MSGTFPTQQRLGVDEEAADQIDLRLVVRLEFIAFEGAMQGGIEAEVLARAVAQSRTEKTAAAAGMDVGRGGRLRRMLEDVCRLAVLRKNIAMSTTGSRNSSWSSVRVGAASSPWMLRASSSSTSSPPGSLTMSANFDSVTRAIGSVGNAAEMTRFLASFSAASETAEAKDATLLLVDDEPSVLSSLKRLLRRENYNILTANSGEGALALLAEHEVRVILTDQRMPGMSGSELLARVRKMHPRTVRMVLSGYTGLDSLTEAINLGEIYKFIAKPWDEADLIGAVRDAFRHYADTGEAPR
ncbi:MAG: response regulator [Sulfuritalea sp.]|nr:response regulator [Sulfuritalea sp.]